MPGFHRDNIRRIDEENSPLGSDRDPRRFPHRMRPCLGCDFTNMRIAVIQKTSIARFVTAPVPEVLRDPARPSIGVYFQFILLPRRSQLWLLLAPIPRLADQLRLAGLAAQKEGTLRQESHPTLETSAHSLALAVCPYLTLTGSTVPSDHRPAGTMNTSIGSGAPLNWGFSMTGELVDGAVNTVAVHFIGRPRFTAMPWTVFYFGHTGMLLATLICIALIGHGRFREFGFKAPSVNGYVYAALLFGVLFGIVMTAADYAHNIIAHLPPEKFFLSSTNLAGSLTFEGLYAGTVEEILFRGLLVTFLAQRMSGHVRLGRFDLHVAGLIVAVLFCLAHVGSFWTQSFRVAASQQAYAFLWGVIYAYWYEKSCSLLPSIIGHNVGNLIEYLLAFLMAWRWS